MKAYIFECIGTFFLVLTIALSKDPLAIGLVLTCLVYAGASVSGAHYNPAVSFTLYLRNILTLEKLKGYIISQSLGALAAVTVSTVIFHTTLQVQPGASISWLSALIAEFLYTFLLLSVILHVAASKKTQGNNYFGLAIGITVFAGAKSVGVLSGGAFNPAVGIAPLLANIFLNGRPVDPSLFFLYTIGPVCAAFVAAYVHRYTQN